MVHDDNTGPITAEFVIRSNSFTKLLLQILEHYGLDLKQVTRRGSDKKLWVEIEEVKQYRNNILHRGDSASQELAKLSLEIAIMLLRKLYPALRQRVVSQ